MDDQLRQYKETVRSGIKSLPWPKQMERLFGEGDHFITHYSLSAGPKQWNTEVFFGSRYELTLQLEVDIDYDKRTVIHAATRPKFYLREVDRVKIAPSGQPTAFYSNDWTFDEARWQTLVTSGGNWSQIGITLKNIAVPGFDDYVKAMRAPRVKVSH